MWSNQPSANEQKLCVSSKTSFIYGLCSCDCPGPSRSLLPGPPLLGLVGTKAGEEDAQGRASCLGSRRGCNCCAGAAGGGPGVQGGGCPVPAGRVVGDEEGQRKRWLTLFSDTHLLSVAPAVLCSVSTGWLRSWQWGWRKLSQTSLLSVLFPGLLGLLSPYETLNTSGSFLGLCCDGRGLD